MFHFGFSYVGLIYLLMLFIPNAIWTKNQPKEYEKYAKGENKVLQILLKDKGAKPLFFWYNMSE